ncbi:MAG: quinolinate synthase NadA [Candidatus Cloacimonas sp.]|nr:quinolinate synthase NadA [Candidatus Cloacimonadota bacterium]
MKDKKAITEIICKIERLKKEKDALILAHNYQPLEIHSVADLTGDSLQLAEQAAQAGAKMIVMCGVKFMGETVKLLNPDAKVLLSHQNAGCPMADMITGEQLREFKAQYPNNAVVCYVNSTVEVKAESDICCTSSNAVRVLQSIPEDKTILFVPDQNLGSYAAEKSNRKVVTWQGYCSIHQIITVEDVKIAREKYPDYTIVVHPECTPDVVKLADLAASTKGMADYVEQNDKVILGTEVGLYELMKSRFPEKKVLPLSEKAICPDMKRSSLPLLLEVLETESNEIIIDKDIAERALKPIAKMLEI